MNENDGLRPEELASLICCTSRAVIEVVCAVLPSLIWLSFQAFHGWSLEWWR